MELIKDIWSKLDYQEYVKYLISLTDEKNKAFEEKLIYTKYEILGIKLPILRDIGKQIAKGDYKSFIKYNDYKYHEENLIRSFVIAYSKDLNILNEYLDECDKYKILYNMKDIIKAYKKEIKDNEQIRLF